MSGIKHTDTVLDKILASKALHLLELELRYGKLLTTRGKKSTRSFFAALKKAPTQFILECKKASPSKGLIRENFDALAIAKTYAPYAAAISVLTDEAYFQGGFEYLKAVSKAVTIPVLCKDFIFDIRQIRLARHMGADAVLLMLSVLDDALYLTLRQEAQALGLDVLTEVSNQQEMQRASLLKAKIIGINNRNLRYLSIDLATTEQLARLAPKDSLLISESGIYTQKELKRLAPLVNGFLVGSSLTEQQNIDLACRTLIYGHIKICGLTRAKDAMAAAKLGASYGGLIFAKKSPRLIDKAQAKTIISSANLNYVGVFVNEQIETVASLANELALYAVQLHGSEDENYIKTLRSKLKATQIWKAVKADGTNKVSNAERLLYDSHQAEQFGGTGQAFDWQAIGKERFTAMLAGGLNPENFRHALNTGFYGFDLNSGVEQRPGIKDKHKIAACLKLARQY